MNNKFKSPRRPSTYIKLSSLSFSVFLLACQGPGIPDPSNYTVSFDLAGGTGDFSAIAVASGSLATNPTPWPYDAGTPADTSDDISVPREQKQALVPSTLALGILKLIRPSKMAKLNLTLTRV